jgi:hypothetical protein
VVDITLLSHCIPTLTGKVKWVIRLREVGLEPRLIMIASMARLE